MGFDGSTLKRKKKESEAGSTKEKYGDTDSAISYSPGIGELFRGSSSTFVRLAVGMLFICAVLAPFLLGLFDTMETDLEEQHYYNELEKHDSQVVETLHESKLEDKKLLNCVQTAMQAGMKKNLSEVDILMCMGEGVSSLDGIDQLSGLTILNLTDNNIENIFDLLYLPKIKTLSLQDNPVKNISTLKEIDTLESVMLPNLPEVFCYKIHQAVKGIKSNVKNIECKGKWTPGIKEIDRKRRLGLELTIEEENAWIEYEQNQDFMPDN